MMLAQCYLQGCSYIEGHKLSYHVIVKCKLSHLRITTLLLMSPYYGLQQAISMVPMKRRYGLTTERPRRWPP